MKIVKVNGQWQVRWRGWFGRRRKKKFQTEAEARSWVSERDRPTPGQA